MKKRLVTGLAAVVAVALQGASTVCLDGEWRLDYFPQPDHGAVRTLPLPAGIDVRTVQATVPGNCELDLVRAGVLPNPEVGTNALALRPYEGFQWLYSKTFEMPVVAAGRRVELVFGGIDTLPLVVGFIAAFVAGCLACKWMINIVKRGKLVWFGVYCIFAALLAFTLANLMPAPAV